jgi:hypothetical protein
VRADARDRAAALGGGIEGRVEGRVGASGELDADPATKIDGEGS